MFTAGSEPGEARNPLWDAPLYHASFLKEEYFDLLTQSGFSDISHKLEDPECQGRSVELAEIRDFSKKWAHRKIKETRKGAG